MSANNYAVVEEEFFDAADGIRIHLRSWIPPSPRGVVQIVHGAAEHSGRYARFAAALNAEGYAAYATDHRGHGLTRVRSGALGDAGPDAWNRFVDDELALGRQLRHSHSGLPLILFGHSLGSFIVQDMITRPEFAANAVILSGTAYGPPPPREALEALDSAAKQEPLGPSVFWAERFAAFNQPFEGPTGFEWLSRDAEEVRRYVEDPLCGFAFTNELVRDYLHGMAALRDPAREENIPLSLPFLVIQGQLDPVGAKLAATQALLDRYRALGLEKVEHRFYASARHELLNDVNRDEVTADVLRWINSATGQITPSR